MEKKFRTKTGYCHITEDKIILTRSGVIGGAADLLTGNNIARILIIYGLFSLALFYYAYDNYKDGNWFSAILFALLGVYLFYAILRSLKYSATPVIERKDILSVQFIQALPGRTRSRFVVEFKVGKKTRKRLILLPGSLTGGAEETEKALGIMREEGLVE